MATSLQFVNTKHKACVPIPILPYYLVCQKKIHDVPNAFFFSFNLHLTRWKSHWDQHLFFKRDLAKSSMTTPASVLPLSFHFPSVRRLDLRCIRRFSASQFLFFFFFVKRQRLVMADLEWHQADLIVLNSYRNPPLSEHQARPRGQHRTCVFPTNKTHSLNTIKRPVWELK